ncbi:MAG: Citronellol and citronellal dehydrogenase [Myxococcales bacterium]|nr:Citronellol and citronellal dehydrogenase [Myxococcales bacterium]
MLPVDAARKNPFVADLMKGQSVIVTGGGTGIGRATAIELLQLGARVAIGSRKPEHLDPTVKELSALGEVIALPCDIREPDSVAAFVDGVLERLGRIDVLVNNAGGQFPSPAEHLSARGFEAVVRNNLNGTFFMTREVAVRAMIPQKAGSIVNVIANIARGFPGMAHTGAARAGVENLTKTLAVEWAQHDVRVNAVAPGIIQSTGIAQYPPELVKMSVARTPQKRIGTVEEVAHSIVYLASPAAAFITGTTLQIDGGASLWGDSWLIPDRE